MERIVSSTYKAPFKKIVTTEPMRSKFSLDKAFKMRVALDPEKIRVANNLLRKPNSVLVPLRDGAIKGSYYALKAMNIVLEEDADIIFYAFGDLPFRSENNRIVFLGKVSDKKLLELYQQCEIFVLPSVEDGIPGPALEAMLNGCAPVCTNVSGASEIIENKKNGIIVPIKNERALADAILFLKSNPDMINKFRTENAKFMSKFTPESMCDSFLDCIYAYESEYNALR
jgi:glycosyltransferase involved in cell wall biosynthesis